MKPKFYLIEYSGRVFTKNGKFDSYYVNDALFFDTYKEASDKAKELKMCKIEAI